MQAWLRQRHIDLTMIMATIITALLLLWLIKISLFGE